MQDDAVEILGKQQVRTLADMEDLLTLIGFEHVAQFVQRGVLDETLGLDIYAERVVRQE